MCLFLVVRWNERKRLDRLFQPDDRGSLVPQQRGPTHQRVRPLTLPGQRLRETGGPQRRRQDQRRHVHVTRTYGARTRSWSALAGECVWF